MTWPAWLEASHRRSLRLRDRLRQDKRLAGAVGGWPAAETPGPRPAALGRRRAEPLYGDGAAGAQRPSRNRPPKLRGTALTPPPPLWCGGETQTRPTPRH